MRLFSARNAISTMSAAYEKEDDQSNGLAVKPVKLQEWLKYGEPLRAVEKSNTTKVVQIWPVCGRTERWRLKRQNSKKFLRLPAIWLALDLLKIASCSHTLVSVKNLVHATLYIGGRFCVSAWRANRDLCAAAVSALVAVSSSSSFGDVLLFRCINLQHTHRVLILFKNAFSISDSASINNVMILLKCDHFACETSWIVSGLYLFDILWNSVSGFLTFRCSSNVLGSYENFRKFLSSMENQWRSETIPLWNVPLKVSTLYASDHSKLSV